MKERPILFSAPMVRAILDGSKTQTRRVMKPQPSDDCAAIDVGMYHPTITARDGEENPGHECYGAFTRDGYESWPSRYGQPGDRLWVRETFMPGYYHEPENEDGPKVSLIYRADNIEATTFAPSIELAEQWDRDFSDDGDEPPPWRPSIHMPRWASRVLLEITDVRVERLKDISEADAWSEGCKRGEPHDSGGGLFPADEVDPSGIGERGWDNARDWFADLWESINGAESWDANQWVWVVSFKRIDTDAQALKLAPSRPTTHER